MKNATYFYSLPRCRSPPIQFDFSNFKKIELEERQVKKTYWVKNHSHGVLEWVEMNGKQFYEFITSPNGKDRFFADYGDYMIEVTKDEYREWKREVNHRRYLKGFEDEILVYSLDSFDESDGISYAELIVDMTVNIEDEISKRIDLQALAAAVRSLPSDEQRLISDLFMVDKPKTEQEIATAMGVSKQAIKKKKALQPLISTVYKALRQCTWRGSNPRPTA